MSRLMEGLSSFPSTATTSQEDHEIDSGSPSSRKLKVTLLSSEWRSTKGGLSTINRELAIQLAKHPSVEISVYLPQCSEEDKRVAASHNVHIIEAEKMPGLEPELWLSCLPEDHAVDCVVGHGAVLGRQVQIIKRHHHCKWVQVVHTAPEELGMYKGYEERISKGEKKHQVEIELCKLADQVVAVGPKLAEAFSGYLRPCGKDQDVLNVTPGIFSEFADVKQATEERSSFSVLVFGRGDDEDFQLKGYDIAAKAIAELKDMTYKLVFVGATSGEEEKVAEMLLQQGIDRSQLRVRRFNESREQLTELFCEVDLALMPSRTEGFGLAALEALSAGLPVLVSGNSGLGKALKKVPYGSNCVLQSEDPKDWASAIKAVRYKDREMRLGEFEVIRGAYAKKYSWKEQSDKLVEMITNITGGAAKRYHGSKSSKQPLSSGNIPSPQQPTMLRVAGTENSVVVKLLRAEYKRRSNLRPLSWFNTIQLPLKNVYTRLQIVSRRKEDFQLIENIEVDMYDIFKAIDKDEEVKMTLVEGSPGIGKTTFCLKIAYDWACEEIKSNCSFPKFELVLLLKCRDMDGGVMEAIKEQLLPEDIKVETWTKLSDFIKDIDNQERILIILDGLDELPETSRQYVDRFLNRRILPSCYVLATSRQETGIYARKNFEFNRLLQIEGFTYDDAVVYIRRHFENVGPAYASEGERLIKEIEVNALLFALLYNPLNLLLLCVVYEDYKGKLPTARTELYQVVVQCLLRRYCAKQNLAAAEDNSALEKQFEADILALGELAWSCLLSYRHGFCVSELEELESRYKGLVSRHIGLLYKEESLKRLNPQHEYYFLHKTFQEYLAAAYIANQLRGKQLNLFENLYLSFEELVAEYRQVFLFVSGILGREASILFTQIGEKLKKNGEWDWYGCNQTNVAVSVGDSWDDEDKPGWLAATFFTESFSESGHAEQMAETLCSFIPFPQNLEINFGFDSMPDDGKCLFHVLKACKSFPNLQKPTEVTVVAVDTYFARCRFDIVLDVIEFSPQLERLNIVTEKMTLSLADVLLKGLSTSSRLSEVSLEVIGSIPCDTAFVIGKGLAASKSLKQVTLALGVARDDAWASAIESGLSADTPLTSLCLEVRGLLTDTAIRALGKLSSNNALTSFSLEIFGDMQDLVAAVIGSSIAQQTTLKSLHLNVKGNLSHSGANALEKSLQENRSVNDLKVSICGEIPHNWKSMVEKLLSVKKESVNCVFHPDPCSIVTCNQVAHFCPPVIENGLKTNQHLTVVSWGELSCDGAEAVCKPLARAPLTSLALKVHGKLTDSVVNCISRYVRQHIDLTSLAIDIWGDLTGWACSLLHGISGNNLTIQTEVPNVGVVSTESYCIPDISIVNSQSLVPVFSQLKDNKKKTVNLSIMNDSEETKEWAHLLGDALAANTSLTALDLAINNYIMNAEIGKDLGENLLQSSSLTVLNLAIANYVDMASGWEYKLVNSLAKVTSLTTLSLAINDHGEEGKVEEGSDDCLHGKERKLQESLDDGLMAIKSLSSFSVVINGGNSDEFWDNYLRKCLQENTSLTLLCVTVNNYDEKCEAPVFSIDSDPCLYREPKDWYVGLSDGLARTTSLNELNLTIKNINSWDKLWTEYLRRGLAENKSITTLTVTVSGDSDYDRWFPKLNNGFAKNKSLTELTLILNEYCFEPCHTLFWSVMPDEVDSDENTTLDTLNLTLNVYKEVDEDWLPDLCDGLVKSSSLKILRLQVNNHCVSSDSRVYDFSKLRLKYKSLSSFELTVTFYGA